MTKTISHRPLSQEVSLLPFLPEVYPTLFEQLYRTLVFPAMFGNQSEQEQSWGSLRRAQRLEARSALLAQGCRPLVLPLAAEREPEPAAGDSDRARMSYVSHQREILLEQGESPFLVAQALRHLRQAGESERHVPFISRLAEHGQAFFVPRCRLLPPALCRRNQPQSPQGVTLLSYLSKLLCNRQTLLQQRGCPCILPLFVCQHSGHSEGP